MDETLKAKVERLLDEHGKAFWDATAIYLDRGLCICGRPLSEQDGQYSCHRCGVVDESLRLMRKGVEVRIVDPAEHFEQCVIAPALAYPEIRERIDQATEQNPTVN